jgi:hypothetical protein
VGWWETSIGGSLLVVGGWIVRRLATRAPSAPGGLREMLARVPLEWVQDGTVSYLSRSLKECHADRERERTDRIQAETENRALRLRIRQLESLIDSGDGLPAGRSSRPTARRRKTRTSSTRKRGGSPTAT